MISIEVKRATFEQVYNAQIDLIFGKTGIDKLIKLEETVAPDSRKIFFENLAISLIGKGLDYPVKLDYNGSYYNLGCVSVFARKMTYFTDTKDKTQTLYLRGKPTKIPIKILWKALRESLYKPMDDALTLALKSSAEIFKSGGESFGVTPEEKL